MGNSIATSKGPSIGVAQMIGMRETSKILGLHPNTIRRMSDDGILPAYRYANGHRRWARKEVVAYATGGAETTDSNTVVLIYCRCSTSRQARLKESKQGGMSSDLVRQIERMKLEAQTRYPGLEYVIYSDTGSGMNYERKNLSRCLDEVLAGKWDNSIMLVENRDRLVRFAAPLIEKILSSKGIEVVYTAQEDNTAEQDFSADILACIHYFSTKYYSGRQSLRNRAYLSDEVIRVAKQRMDGGHPITKVAEDMSAEGYRTESGGMLTYAILNKYVYQQMKKLEQVQPAIESSAKLYKKEFVEECSGENVLPIHLVYAHYEQWATAHNLIVVSKRRFGAEWPFAHQVWIKGEGRQRRSWRGYKITGADGIGINCISVEKCNGEETPKVSLLKFARSVSPWRKSQLRFYLAYKEFMENEGKVPLSRPTVVRSLVELGWWASPKMHEKMKVK